MGLYISRLQQLFWAVPHCRVLLIGLDAAGKTTILYKVKLNETVTTIPTIGFNVENVKFGKGLDLTVWDVGGQEKIRRLWKHYFHNLQGILYVVDSTDRERMEEAREELEWVVRDIEEIHGNRRVPVQVLANKQDMPNSMSPSELVQRMSLPKVLEGRQWHVQACCALRGEGLYESFDSLITMMKKEDKN